MSLVEIKPGREVDLAVSAAMNVYYDKRRSDECPHYSTDLNAAFAAAEKVFGNGFIVADYPKVSSCIAMLCEGEQYTIPIPPQCRPSRAETPALAICAAILKMKEPE